MCCVRCARDEFGIASAGVCLPEFCEGQKNQAEYLGSTCGIIQAKGFELDNVTSVGDPKTITLYTV